MPETKVFVASWSTGLLDRYCGGGRPACRRVGLAPPSESQRLESRIRGGVGRAGRWEMFGLTRRPGAPAFWSAAADAAGGPASRISVVARRIIEGLRPRRSRAGGLHPNWDICTGSFCREGCPAAPLCGAGRAAGATNASTMACPARPGEQSYPTRPREHAESVPGIHLYLPRTKVGARLRSHRVPTGPRLRYRVWRADHRRRRFS